jgi:hypothetical protein
MMSRVPGPFTARNHAGSEPYIATGLQQHRDEEIVDEHYTLASCLEAADQFGQWIDHIAGL